MKIPLTQNYISGFNEYSVDKNILPEISGNMSCLQDEELVFFNKDRC